MINAININVNFQRGAAPLARPRARIIFLLVLTSGSGVYTPEFGELFTEDLLKINPRAFRAGVD